VDQLRFGVSRFNFLAVRGIGLRFRVGNDAAAKTASGHSQRHGACTINSLDIAETST